MMDFSSVPIDIDGTEFLSIPALLKSQGGKELSLFQGQVLYYEDLKPSGVFFLINGKIKIIKEFPLGKSKMISILNSRNWVGMNDFLNSSVYKYSAVALEDCELIFLNEQSVRNILAFPELKRLITHYQIKID